MATRGEVSMTEIESKVRALIAARLGKAARDAPDDARFVEDLHAASLDMVEFIMSAEDEFGVEIPDAASEKFHTIADVVGFLEAELAARPTKGASGERPEIRT
jgi:acyl carrier protein